MGIFVPFEFRILARGGEMSKQELKPCPKCRSHVEWEYADWDEDTGDGDDGTGRIVCQCGIESPRMLKDEAEEWWHTRTPDPMLEELAGALEEIARCLSHGLQDCRASIIAKDMLGKYQQSKVQP